MSSRITRRFAFCASFLLLAGVLFFSGCRSSRKELKRNILIPEQGKKYLGAFVTMRESQAEEKFVKFAKTAGKAPAIHMTFVIWNKEGKANYPVKFAENAYKMGAVPMITWEPQFTYMRTKDAPMLADIADGKYDKYIISFLKQGESFGKPFFVRFGHEMEGAHYPWSERYNKEQSKENYIKAFRKVAALAREVAPDSIVVWSPGGGAHNADAYYPGDEYVDWIGASLYNFPKWPQDPMFNDQLGAWIRILKKHNKPAMICEMGCAEKYIPHKGWDPDGNGKYDDHKPWVFPGMASKTKWLDRFFDIMEKNPQIKGCVWFNINKEADWRIDSSPEALGTFRKRISNPIYLSAKK